MKVIIIISYKAAYNIGIAFNLDTIEFFDSFYTRILVFLFAIVYYNISKY